VHPLLATPAPSIASPSWKVRGIRRSVKPPQGWLSYDPPAKQLRVSIPSGNPTPNYPILHCPFFPSYSRPHKRLQTNQNSTHLTSQRRLREAATRAGPQPLPRARDICDVGVRTAQWHGPLGVEVHERGTGDFCSLMTTYCPLPLEAECAMRLLRVFYGGKQAIRFLCPFWGLLPTRPWEVKDTD